MLTVSPVAAASCRQTGLASWTTSSRAAVAPASLSTPAPRRYLPRSPVCSTRRCPSSVATSRNAVLLCTPSSPAISVTPASPIRASTSRIVSARSTDCTPGATPSLGPGPLLLGRGGHDRDTSAEVVAYRRLRSVDATRNRLRSARGRERSMTAGGTAIRDRAVGRLRPGPLLPGPSRDRARGQRLPRRARRQHPGEPAVRRPPLGTVLHAHRLQRHRPGRRGALRRDFADVAQRVRHGVRALGRRGAVPDAGDGLAPPALPQRPALPHQHRSAADRDPARWSPTTPTPGPWCGPTASTSTTCRSRRTPRRTPRSGCWSWWTGPARTWWCWRATCRCCPTTCAASCPAAPSTSTTRSCPASRAPGPTTRPSTAASSWSARPRTT